MEYWINLGLFAGKAFILVSSIIIVLIVFFSLVYRYRHQHHLEVENLNEKYNDLAAHLKQNLLTKQELKAEKKRIKKMAKAQGRSRIFVIDFEGDIKASAVSSLREEVSTIIKMAKPGDQAVLRLESAGGMVHGYGLAAAQLKRFKEHNIPLTVCVDKVAASGGYLMACTADKIIASPFAIVGSIGVLAQVPNFNRLLKKHDIDYQEITSGEYKRTISILGEITPKGREKFQEEVVDTHQLFKEFVSVHRPQLDMAKVGTGEHWFGTRAIELRLVDQLNTSDEHLILLLEKFDVIRISYEAKKKLSEKLAHALSLAVTKSLDRSLETFENNRYL